MSRRPRALKSRACQPRLRPQAVPDTGQHPLHEALLRAVLWGPSSEVDTLIDRILREPGDEIAGRPPGT